MIYFPFGTAPDWPTVAQLVSLARKETAVTWQLFWNHAFFYDKKGLLVFVTAYREEA